MPTYVIEREIAGAGNLCPEELKTIAQRSNAVLAELAPAVQWMESYVTADKIYCIYIAPDELSVREHARRGGFPADRVSRVSRRIDPTTAE